MKDLPLFALGFCLLAIGLVCAAFLSPPGWAEPLGLGAVAAMTFALGDAMFSETRALPNGAATVNSTGFNLRSSVTGDFLANCEFLIQAPALTTGQLADTQTMKYSIQHSNASDFSGAVTEADLITQTGAGGAGSVAAEKRWRPPTNVGSYVRLRVIKSGAGDASAATATFKLLF